MEAKILYVLLIISIASSSFAQDDKQSNPSKHKNLVEFKDPIDNSDWMTISTRVWSEERTGIRNRRFCANYNFVVNYSEDKWDCNMRFVVNTNIEEWPIQSKAYAIVNDKKYEIKLIDAHSRYYNIKEESTDTDANGISTTSISTRDFQLFKKECNLSDILKDVRFIQNFSIVIYSADIPIKFNFDEADMNKLQAVLQ
jgi:hypothetical protein